MHKWFVFKKFEQAAQAAADFIAETIEITLEQSGRCHVALSGGNTPKYCLTCLAAKNLSWHKVHWYLGDEHCLPVGHVERNDVMLDKYLWSQISDTHIHRIRTEQGAETAAALYREVISDIGHFDIVFLGVGEDGHTASLFPDNAALSDKYSVVPVYNAPKSPSERVSLSAETLKKSSNRIILAGGKEKASIIKRIKVGEMLPVNSVGDIHWYIDAAT